VTRRVVVTGMGVVTPLGNDVETFWSRLVRGDSGVRAIENFDCSRVDSKVAGEVVDFDPSHVLDRKEGRRNDRYTQFALVATREAMEQAGLPERLEGEEADRTGTIIGSGLGGSGTLVEQITINATRGPDRVSPFFIPMGIANMASGQAAITFGARGPNFATVSACATAGHAIGEAAEMILRDDADTMLAGGSEAPVYEALVAAFDAMRALSRRNDDPERASRPFDAERDGFVMGEAGGILVLEELEHAKKRDAKIYAELVGYGMSSDAQHITEPDPTGRHPARAMHMAMDDAGIGPEAIDYINAHGTSTPLGDASETRVIKIALGEEKARKTPISSTKGATGHCLGASGAIEALICTLAVQRDVVPPTINYEYPDPECDLDYIPNESREWKTDFALSNNFGFGGHNACLVFKKFDCA
jgi:3-oxoacyl-[acyl-carrier-protein] synthase II